MTRQSELRARLEREMSGFIRDPRQYGDRLVYEALDSKWSRYHRHCSCDRRWLDHAREAGFTVVRDGGAFVAITGPGLTEDVDEEALTTDTLFEAVTGKLGSGRVEDVIVVHRTPATEAANDAYYGAKRERAVRAKMAPLTAKQLSYLERLASRTEFADFDSAFLVATKGTDIAPRDADEQPAAALKRLTKAAASKLIGALVD